jgi:two-component system, response regulator RegA
MSNVKEVAKDTPVVLVVDDEAVFRERLCRAFRERGWDAQDAGGAEQTMELARRISPDLVLLDLRMPGTSGLDLIGRIKSLDSTITVVILTGYGSIPTALQALKLGADHYLSKPVDVDQILAAYEDLHAKVPGRTTPLTVPSLARVEWEHIQRVLSDCSGNITQAAKLLGIHRRSLQRKLAKYPPGR